MIAKAVKYLVIAAVAAIALTLACSQELRYEVSVLWVRLVGDAVDKMELQVDQGALALQRFDSEYARAQQNLVRLKGVARDTQYSMRRAEEQARDYRAQGKEELAVRNDEQYAFHKEQLASTEAAIERRTAKLETLKRQRERAREDVRLTRERIAVLSATRDALDETGMRENLERAEENVRNLQSSCNRLKADIEVLNLTED